MKSRLESPPAFVFHLAREVGSTPGEICWNDASLIRAIRERDRQWERMLAELYREWKSRRR